MPPSLRWWWSWAAKASDLLDVAPEEIHDDLDVLAALGQALQEPVIEDGVLQPLDVTMSDINRAREGILAEIERSCTD